MTLGAILRLWTNIRRTAHLARSAVSSPPEFDLGQHNRLARQPHFLAVAGAQISPSCETFPLSPDGGRKDFKGSRVVDKECASRSFSE
jgi:hypothetical protein